MPNAICAIERFMLSQYKARDSDRNPTVLKFTSRLTYYFWVRLAPFTLLSGLLLRYCVVIALVSTPRRGL